MSNEVEEVTVNLKCEQSKAKNAKLVIKDRLM